MRYRLLALILSFSFSACTSVQDSSKNALDTVGNETGASWNKMRELLDLGPPKEKTGAPQPRYCYHTYEDIICYSQPLVGEEYRLTSYQEPSGKAGYVLPEGYTIKTQTVVPPPTVVELSPAADKPPEVKMTDLKPLAAAKPAGDKSAIIAVDAQMKTVKKTADKTAAAKAKANPTGASNKAADDKAAKKSTDTAAAKVASAKGQSPDKPKEEKKPLKEVIFDPAELEPKQLVPDKPQ